MKVDLLDKAIAIAIILFILSMISERIVTWLKLQFGRKGHHLFLFSKKEDDDSKRNPDPDEEKKREQKVLGLNIVVSVLLSLIAGADLFEIVSRAEPFEALGYPNWDEMVNRYNNANGQTVFSKVLGNIIGCILSGFFISLGSKFWHDTLDMLFFTKNLKQKLSDPQTFTVKSVDELDEFLKLSANDLVNIAIAQNEVILKTKFPNIRFINDTVVTRGSRKIEVMTIYLKDSNTVGLPAVVPVKLPSGKTFQVDVEVVVNTGTARVSNGLTGPLFSSMFPNSPGSGCCVLTDGSEHFLLTNCHVLTGGFNQSPLFNVSDRVFYDQAEVGSWFYGSISAAGDIATVKIDNFDLFTANNQPEIFNNQTRKLSKPDDINKQVNARGGVTKLNSRAFIVDIVLDKVGVEYKDGSIQKFREAILLGDRPDLKNCRPPTDFGDSGGVVFDDNNQLIGIITAKDDRYAYATPIDQFLRDFNLQIV